MACIDVHKILKKINPILLCLLAFSLAALASEKDIKIKDVIFSDSTLTINHDSFGDIKFKRRIYENPPRLVFDLIDAHLGERSFKFDLPKGSDVTVVRVAQFDDTTVRVVSEAKTVTALEKINIENIGQNLFFKFHVNDVEIQDISFLDGDMRITASGPLVPRTILLDNPERLVLDLIGAKLKSEAQAQKFTNGSEVIRVARFDDSIVRIVFTGTKTHKREVRISNNERQLLVLASERSEVKTETNPNKIPNKVLGLKIIKDTKDESIYAVESVRKLDYKFMKIHNPERLLVDLIGVNFDEALAAIQLPPTAQVENVRLGLATLGSPVTRIVFDLKSKNLLEEFKEGEGGKTLLIRMLGTAEDKIETISEIDTAQKSLGSAVVIDAGHGGYDHGAIYGGYNEKDITLSLAHKLAGYLEAAGIKSLMVRNDDRFISLAERVEVSNSIDPKLFVSVHVNALATNPNMEGLQTYYYSPSGLELANVVHKQLLKDVGMPDQRVRKAGFWVIKYTQVPSILLELGFMTNVEERKKLTKDSYQNDLAKAVARGIINYLEGAK